MSDTEVETLVMNDLRGMFGDDIPAPIGMLRTAWHGNSLSLGSYPHLKPERKMDACDIIAENLSKRVFFAGDYVIQEYLATAHGAYISGRRAAQQIIDSIK